MTKIFLELSIGIFRLVHLPHSFVVAQEGKDRGSTLEARLQANASHCQCPTLAPAGRTHSLWIDIRHLHHNLRQLRCIQENLPEKQLIWIALQSIIQAANDVTRSRCCRSPRPGLPKARLARGSRALPR